MLYVYRIVGQAKMYDPNGCMYDPELYDPNIGPKWLYVYLNAKLKCNTT